MEIIFDIDELVSAGTVRLSSATLETLKLELETRDSGHHVGDVAFIHSARAVTNARLLSEDAQRQYYEEFGVQNPNALEFYRNQHAKAAAEANVAPVEQDPDEPEMPGPPADTAPDAEPVPLPEHPALDNEPPSEEQAFLREEEAKDS